MALSATNKLVSIATANEIIHRLAAIENRLQQQNEDKIIHRLAAIENRLQQQNENLQKNLTHLQAVLEKMNHTFSECCETMKGLRFSPSPTNVSDGITQSEVSLSPRSEPRSSHSQSNMTSPNPSMNTQSPSPNNSPQLDHKSASRKQSEVTAAIALHSRTMQTKSTAKDEFEVHCVCQSDLPVIPLIHNDLVHLILWGQENISGRDNRHLLTGTLESYLFDSQKTGIRKNFSNCVKHVCPTILMYAGEVTLLGGDVEVDTKKYKLALYQMHSTTMKDFYAWESIMCSISKVSTSSIDFKNSVCASYGNDGVAVVSICGPNQLNIKLFSPTRTVGNKHWKNVLIKLPDDKKYKIQSCVAISNYIYCSLLVQERENCYICYIYKINLTPALKQSRETCALDSFAEIDKISNLGCCFLSALNEKLISITSECMANGKTLLEVKQRDHSACITLASPFQYYFSSQVRIVTASVVSGIQNTLVVVYHDTLQKCYVKKLTLYY